MRFIPLKTAGVLFCGLLTVAASGSALAQDYPNKPIRFIIAQGAGGTSDVLARQVGQKLSESLGQPVVIDNRPGAEGIVGLETAAKAAPDGYTIAMGSTPNLAINYALYKKLPYDPIADFASIALIGKTFYAVLVPTTSQAQSLGDFITMARARPNQLNYGAGSSGARANIELFTAATKIQLSYVPYKSNTQALTDLVGGRLDLVLEPTSSAMPQVRGGKVKALAITSTTRLAQYPDLPTVSESGVPGFEYSAWASVIAPAGISPAIQHKLSLEVQKAIAKPDVIEKFRSLGFETQYAGPEQLSAMLRSDIAAYIKVVKDVGIPQQ